MHYDVAQEASAGYREARRWPDDGGNQIGFNTVTCQRFFDALFLAPGDYPFLFFQSAWSYVDCWYVHDACAGRRVIERK
jgi:hypothetical protein